jgi:hypothetical protein
MSIRGIAEYLTEGGYRTKTGKPTWGKSTVQRILRNETCCGVWHYNKYKRVKQLGKKDKLILRDQAEWYKVTVPAIIDRETFDLAQVRMAQNKETWRRQPKRTYLLGQMIFCAECGKPYYCQTDPPDEKHRRPNEVQSYRHRRSERHCHNRQIAANIVDTWVWEQIQRLLTEPKTIQVLWQRGLDKKKADYANQHKRIERLEKAEEKIKTQLARHDYAFTLAEARMTEQQYLQTRLKILDELDNVTEQITTLQEVQPSWFKLDQFTRMLKVMADVSTVGTIKASVKINAPSGVMPDNTWNVEKKRQLLRHWQARVLIGNDNITLELGMLRDSSDQVYWLQHFNVVANKPYYFSIASLEIKRKGKV